MARCVRTSRLDVYMLTGTKLSMSMMSVGVGGEGQDGGGAWQRNVGQRSPERSTCRKGVAASSEIQRGSTIDPILMTVRCGVPRHLSDLYSSVNKVTERLTDFVRCVLLSKISTHTGMITSSPSFGEEPMTFLRFPTHAGWVSRHACKRGLKPV